jgi:curli biogenesis system outer membrane secretion channel CsgG
MLMNRIISSLAIAALSVGLFGCTATETHRVVETPKVESYDTQYSGPKTTFVVNNFQNRSSYMQGLFSSGDDLLGNQAKTILKTHLQQTNRFNVVDRDNMAQIQEEAGIRGQKQNLKGARYVVTGSVTEFGRKVTGDKQLFGIVGAGKNQIAYSKVALNIVDVLTSEIIYSTQGAGEYKLSEREVLGFGSNAGYDSTLNGKVLNLAITEAVNELVRAHTAGKFNVAQ